jgi:FMN-dependent NADH-azoreductase
MHRRIMRENTMLRYNEQGKARIMLHKKIYIIQCKKENNAPPPTTTHHSAIATSFTDLGASTA